MPVPGSTVAVVSSIALVEGSCYRSMTLMGPDSQPESCGCFDTSQPRLQQVRRGGPYGGAVDVTEEVGPTHSVRWEASFGASQPRPLEARRQ